MRNYVVSIGLVMASAGCLLAGDPATEADVLVPMNGELVPASMVPDGHNLGIVQNDLISPAALVYDNGPTDLVTGQEMSSFKEACDFTIGAAASVGRCTFAAFDFTGADFAAWDGTVSWELWSDGGGSPGAMIDSGTGTGISRTFIGTNGSGWDYWEFDMDLDHNAAAPAGTSWWVLNMNASCAVREDFYMGTTAVVGANSNFDNGCTGVWTITTYDCAFALYTPTTSGNCIDFDDLAEPCGFSSTTALRNKYAGQGVTFDGPAARDGGGILDQCGGFGANAHSGSNFLAFNRGAVGAYSDGGTPTDPQTILFSPAVSGVSLWVSGGGGSTSFRMLAYDASGNTIDADSETSPAGGWIEMNVAAAGIARVEVHEVGGDNAFMMDTLCWDRAQGSCLDLRVSKLVASQQATWDVSGATPGEQVGIVYGFQPGTTGVNGSFSYCATFDIKGVNATKVVCKKNADGAGTISCTKTIPGNLSGARLLTQAAERNTCPKECVSNLDDQIIG